ncbi:MAG TPA: hypothetical protein DET40_24540 [Lentisphaeria bacterium]|nr:MAG: hypothetical protein A2X45_22955 [Lentisphaerae bacterium GWF2_50_93]HCE46728.1 hypothetical protein [Lentisphaeria bacterium]
MEEIRKDTFFRMAGILGLTLILALILWAQKSTSEKSESMNTVHTPHNHSDPTQHGHEITSKEIKKEEVSDLKPSGTLESGVRIVDYDAYKYGFEPDPLVVVAGEKVRLRVKSRDVVHGMMIPEIDFSTDMPIKERKTVEFHAPVKSGEYPVFCSVFCGSGHGNMKGRMIVLPATEK